MISTIDQIPQSLKRVVVRLDLNLPMVDGVIQDPSRLLKSLPTLRDLLAKGHTLTILAHLGRPKGMDMSLSLKPICDRLAQEMGQYIAFIPSPSTPIPENTPIVMLENLRFFEGEETNNPAFASSLAALGEAYVNDGFSVSHRAHASVEGITHFLPSFGGRLLMKELDALTLSFENPTPPIMVILGGSKISTKIDLLKSLMKKATYLVPGGGIANTFLKAQGYSMGTSLVEIDKITLAQEVMEMAHQRGCTLILPQDVVCETSKGIETVEVDHIPEDGNALDLGPKTLTSIVNILPQIKTVLWNGPLGYFERPPFDQSSLTLAKAIGKGTQSEGLISIAGGGETLGMLDQAGVTQDFTYISTAGGAFLEYLEGKTLPGIQRLIIN